MSESFVDKIKNADPLGGTCRRSLTRGPYRLAFRMLSFPPSWGNPKGPFPQTANRIRRVNASPVTTGPWHPPAPGRERIVQWFAHERRIRGEWTEPNDHQFLCAPTSDQGRRVAKTRRGHASDRDRP